MIGKVKQAVDERARQRHKKLYQLSADIRAVWFD
jgi:hypothetical protein